MISEQVSEIDAPVVRLLRFLYRPVLRWSLAHRQLVGIGIAFLALWGFDEARNRVLPALEEGNLWIWAPCLHDRSAAMPAVTKMREIAAPPEVVTVGPQHDGFDNGSDAAGFNNVELFVPPNPFEEWAPE
jgi:cobalt-zinc-cadmium resistance protein CzcA